MKSDVKDTILKLLQMLLESNTPIIVEGKKDKAAIEQFFDGQILTLSKSPLYQVAEVVAELPTRRVCILTDLDRKGKKLYSILSTHLGRLGVTVDNELRHYLLRKTTLSHMEGIATYLEGLESKIHHKTVE